MRQSEKERANQLSDDISDYISTTEWGQSIPGNTCPLINGIQHAIHGVIRDLKAAAKATEDQDAEDAILEAIRNLSNIDEEPIREANETLRELGKKWYKACKEIRYKVDEYCTRIEVNEETEASNAGD